MFVCGQYIYEIQCLLFIIATLLAKSLLVLFLVCFFQCLYFSIHVYLTQLRFSFIRMIDSCPHCASWAGLEVLIDIVYIVPDLFCKKLLPLSKAIPKSEALRNKSPIHVFNNRIQLWCVVTPLLIYTS
jgi:hypothetical protein